MGTIIGVQMDADTRAAGPRSRETDFEEWMTARQPALLRTACLLTGETHTAEDLVQTTLAKIYLAWDRIADREHVDAYARKTLLNEYRSLWRRPWRRRELSSEQLPDVAARESSYDGHSDALWEFVATLPPKQRAVIVLRYYEELSEAETAAALGIAVGTVKSQASRALASLRRTVGEHPGIDRPGTGAEEER
ncbi:MAG TPA: SigE family RNA polymerase sigma factor [Marmoricola sp.]|nr:SigE family RNA polymerase sigma factor [Marmoricola sp.]